MKIEEEQRITKNVIVGYKCDVCEKEHKGVGFPDDWHLFSIHHNEWGNDSVDSFSYHEVCSPICYSVKFRACVASLSGRENAEVDGFEIQFARRLVDFQNK